MANNKVPGKIPGKEFYEYPYLPCPLESKEYDSIPLTGAEVNTIIVANAGKQLSTVDRSALQMMSEVESDEFVDLQAARRRAQALLGFDSEYD